MVAFMLIGLLALAENPQPVAARPGREFSRDDVVAVAEWHVFTGWVSENIITQLQITAGKLTEVDVAKDGPAVALAKLESRLKELSAACARGSDELLKVRADYRSQQAIGACTKLSSALSEMAAKCDRAVKILDDVDGDAQKLKERGSDITAAVEGMNHVSGQLEQFDAEKASVTAAAQRILAAR